MSRLVTLASPRSSPARAKPSLLWAPLATSPQVLKYSISKVSDSYLLVVRRCICSTAVACRARLLLKIPDWPCKISLLGCRPVSALLRSGMLPVCTSWHSLTYARYQTIQILSSIRAADMLGKEMFPIGRIAQFFTCFNLNSFSTIIPEKDRLWRNSAATILRTNS